MKQLHPIHTFIWVDKKMPEHMGHFESGFYGIVKGTYMQLYGGDDVKSYSLYRIEDGKIVKQIAWYNEDQITADLDCQDQHKAQQMIEQYHIGVL